MEAKSIGTDPAEGKPWSALSPLIRTTLLAAEHAGKQISERKWATDISSKEHGTFGTSATSDTDKMAEKFIVDVLKDKYPSAIFVAEENAKFSVVGMRSVLEAPLAFFIDPRDGTTEDSHELSFWSVSIGIMMNGVLKGGVVVAPEERGGLAIVCDEDGETLISEHGKYLRPVAHAVHVAEGAKPLVHLGLDVQRLNAYSDFIRSLPRDLKPRGISTSGALGLALVAVGRIDAIIQSPQFPWDWAASMAMVSARHKMLATYGFNVQNGAIRNVPIYDPENFSTGRQTLGFVIGKPTIAKPVYDLLVKHYGERSP